MIDEFYYILSREFKVTEAWAQQAYNYHIQEKVQQEHHNIISHQ